MGMTLDPGGLLKLAMGMHALTLLCWMAIGMVRKGW